MVTASMTDTQLGHLAAELLDARRRCQVVVPPSQRTGSFELPDALYVLDLLTSAALADGEAVTGLKVGLTYTPTWERIGVHEPFAAPMLPSATGVGPVMVEAFTAPRLEVEVVVSITSPLQPGCTIEDVRDAIGTVSLGFELVDSHYADWKATPVDLVADFGCHAGLRTGQPVVLSDNDLDRLDELEILLTCEGEGAVAVPGRGVDVLGGPLHAVVAALRSTCARDISAGQLVSTGALTGRSHPIASGQRWTAEVVAGPSLPPCSLEVR